jgi:hypothetical protein
MSIKQIAAGTAVVAAVALGAFTSALSDSAITSTTPEVSSVHSLGELLASAPQSEMTR